MKDPNTAVTMSELLDMLEKGKRTYDCFKYAHEVSQRLANHEQVERELIAKAEKARENTEKVEKTYLAACEHHKQEVLAAKAQAEADMASFKSAHAEAVASMQQDMARQKEALQTELEHLLRLVDDQKSAVGDLQQQSVDLVNELRKIEKQVAEARAAKKALLEA